jgi:RNA ligase (TIGR02306 family)
MRKLASVQRVNAVEPIPGADAIERIRVLGWWVVAKKGEYRQGDRIVYVEIDALLPELPAFEFLRASSFKPAHDELPAGFRIRTVKLRGQVSQGICFPLSILPPGAPTDEGADLTELLGVHKWEPPLPLGMGGRVKGGFPGFLSKTDETRVQVLEGVLQRHRGERFVITEKVDGTSFTAFLRDGVYGVCSRNFWMDETDETNLHARVAVRLRVEQGLQAVQARFGFMPAIQAEVIGAGIQKNKYGLKEVTLRVFSVIDLGTGRWVDHAMMLEVLACMGLEAVPQLGTIVLDHSVDELVALAEAPSALNPNVQREGIVLRPPMEQHDPEVGRLSFKVINPRFLLKYDE